MLNKVLLSKHIDYINHNILSRVCLDHSRGVHMRSECLVVNSRDCEEGAFWYKVKYYSSAFKYATIQQ